MYAGNIIRPIRRPRAPHSSLAHWPRPREPNARFHLRSGRRLQAEAGSANSDPIRSSLSKLLAPAGCLVAPSPLALHCSALLVSTHIATVYITRKVVPAAPNALPAHDPLHRTPLPSRFVFMTPHAVHVARPTTTRHTLARTVHPISAIRAAPCGARPSRPATASTASSIRPRSKTARRTAQHGAGNSPRPCAKYSPEGARGTHPCARARTPPRRFVRALYRCGPRPRRGVPSGQLGCAVLGPAANPSIQLCSEYTAYATPRRPRRAHEHERKRRTPFASRRRLPRTTSTLTKRKPNHADAPEASEA